MTLHFSFSDSIVLPLAPIFASTEKGEDLLWHFISVFPGSKEGILTSCQFFLCEDKLVAVCEALIYYDNEG